MGLEEWGCESEAGSGGLGVGGREWGAGIVGLRVWGWDSGGDGRVGLGECRWESVAGRV